MAKSPRAADEPTYEDVMPDHLYFVLRAGAAWTVRYDGADFGPYNIIHDALRVAVGAAKSARSTGASVGVCVEDATGVVKPAWFDLPKACDDRPSKSRWSPSVIDSNVFGRAMVTS